MRTSKLDIADYLDNKDMVAEYLNTVLEAGDSKAIIRAIGHIAKAIGMAKLSEATGLSKPSLDKAFADEGQPQFAIVMKVLKAAGGQIQIHFK